MSTHGDRYILDAGPAGQARLRAIGEIHDDRTRALLLAAGLRAGQRFVELGCGLGSVSRWAAGIGAAAMGLDLSAAHVAEARRLAAGRAEFRVADAYEPSLEPESVDVAYARWLLIHLQRPVDALRSAYAALAPGGVLVCEEADLGAISTEPPSVYHEFRDRAIAGAVARGVDATGGRRLESWARAAGFEIEHVDAYQPRYSAGAHKGFWSWSFREAGLTLVREGSLGRARYDELCEGMRLVDDDPSTTVSHARMHQLVARKPALAG